MYGESGEPAADAAHELVAGPLRILIIDDDIDLGECVCELVIFLGHRETTVARSERALEVARAMRPDVVLLDVGPPGGRGFELVTELRSLAFERPFRLVALTTWSNPRERVRFEAAGVDHHAAKPLGLHALRRLVGEVGQVLRPTPPARWADGSDLWRTVASVELG
jgi:DNA-binding response OmpR family regulator